MTVTRTPTGADLVCLHCGKPGPDLDIDHVQNRGMGGSKERDIPENKVPLCRPCHELKTLGQVTTRVISGSFGDGTPWLIYEWRKANSSFYANVPSSSTGYGSTGMTLGC